MTLARALESPQLAALVLKPTLLGGFARCLELAAAAQRTASRRSSRTRSRDRIGTAACRELARAIGSDVPVGLAPHVAETSSLENVSLAMRRPAFRTIVAEHTEETVAAIRTAFAGHQPIALLHAKAAPDELERQRALVDAARFEHDDAVVLFTSGSTGPSRGVVLSRARVDRRMPRPARRTSVCATTTRGSPACRSPTPAGYRS